MIFVGDCHSWFLDTYFPKLAASGDPAITVEPGVVVHGGDSLEEIWTYTTYLYPDLQALQEGKGKWDFGVIGTGYWYEGEDQKAFTDWVPKYDDAFKKAGAQTVLIVPWVDQGDAGTDAAQKNTAVADGLAAQLGARVAPVGLAVERVRRQRPGLIEYVDEYHVNAPGWYLQMCVLYATLFERSPEGLKYRLPEPAATPDGNPDLFHLWNLPAGWALPDADAAYLQRMAWETVQEHQAQK